MNVLVRDLMCTQVCTVSADAVIDDAVAALLQASTAEVYVVDGEGRLLGVVPDYELLKLRLTRTSGTTPVSSVMSRNVQGVFAGIPVDALLVLFREARTRILPVLEGEKVVGQIGRRDVFRLLEAARHLEESAAEIPRRQAPAPRFARQWLRDLDVAAVE